MSILVTDQGFGPETFAGEILPLAEHLAGPPVQALDLVSTDRAEQLQGRLAGLALIRVIFPAFSDGRGFTIGHDLRRLGFTGRLRAAGHVLADQYAMARRAGFDEVEISEELAARQPEPQWLARADWQALDHRSRLFA